MTSRPTRPIQEYPQVSADEMPPVPPVLPDEPEAPAPAAPPAAAAAAPAVADLDFVATRSALVPLKWPYRRGDGTLVSEIVIRALTLAQMGELGTAGRLGDLYEVYGAMCGVPAAELRGLDADDGSEVVDRAYPFLPRLIRQAHGLS